MSSKSDVRAVAKVVEAVADLLMLAVQATIDDRSPEPARHCTAQFVELDDSAAAAGKRGPAVLMATLAVVRWCVYIREELADRPERTADALGWIEDALGRRFRSRARYTSAVLDSEEGAGDMMDYVDALGEDFLPTLIWLLAGVAAVHGGGDAEWIRRLELPSG